MQSVKLLAGRNSAAMSAVMVAGISVWLALVARTPGFNLWPDMVTGMSGASLYTGTLAAGFAAFEANRWTSANRDRVRFGVRAPAIARLQHATTTVTLIVGGQLLAFVVLGSYAAMSGTYGAPSSAWLAALAGAIVLAAALGYSLGGLFGPYWFVAPGAALLFYGAYVLTAAGPLPYGVRSLFPADTNTDSVFVVHLPLTMLGQLAFWLGVSAVALIAIGGGWRRGGRLFLALGLVVAVAVATIGGSAVLAGNGQVTSGHNPRDFICKTDAFALCLNRGYGSALAPLYVKVASMNARVVGTPLYASRLEQNVEGVGDQPRPAARSIYLEQFASEQDLAFAIYRYLNKYGGDRACPGGVPSTANLYVDRWLSGYNYLLEEQPDRERLGALRKLSLGEGRAWFKAHAQQYFSCTLTLADLP